MLPILISVPHGGTETPPEIAHKVIASDCDIFDDGDAFTYLIYSLECEVAQIERAQIARAFVDLNRAPDDRPPDNPDGVVKSETCYGRPIYDPGDPLSQSEADALLERYYFPYHEALAAGASEAYVKFGIDCHSMAAQPPPASPDPGQERPLFCLSNGEGRTSPMEMLERLADALSQSFAIKRSEIWLNKPFKGGYITRSQPGGIPWVQLEMNRCLYLVDPWFDEDNLRIDSGRLEELRASICTALESSVG